MNLKMVRIKQKISLSMLLAFVTSSRGAPVTYEYNYAPAHEYAPKDYSFSYGVKDLHTGDVKHQWEKKEGEHVRGHYSLVEPDGSVRTVDYSADDKTGFSAVVKHRGSHYHPLSSKATSHNEFLLKQSDVPTQDYVPKSQDYEHAGKNYELAQDDEQEETPEYTYAYLPQEGGAYDEQTGGTEEVNDHEAEGSKTTVKFTTKDVKQPELPVDLSLLKPSSKEKFIPVDVSVLNPVEINLEGHQNVTNTHSSLGPYKNNAGVDYVTQDVGAPLSQEDYQKFLSEYYGSGTKQNFRPLQLTKEEYQQFLKEYYANTKGKDSASTNFRSPNTFRTNKRPVTTPGLRNYSTGDSRFRIPKRNHPRDNNIGPVAFPDKRQGQGASRLHRNTGNKYVRYAKRTTTYVSK